MPDMRTRLSLTGTVLQGKACTWSARSVTVPSRRRIVYMSYFLFCRNMIPVGMSNKLIAQLVFDNTLVNKNHTFPDPLVIDSNQIGMADTVIVRTTVVCALNHTHNIQFDLGILGNDLYHMVNSRLNSPVAV